MPASANASAIELRGCSKFYGENTILDDVSLTVENGEFVTILGPSGCGKTTTLRIIGGFITPDVGTVTIRGRDVTETPPYLRNIGVVFQNYALWPHMTVHEILAFGLKIRKLDRAEMDRRIKRALEMVHLEGLQDRYPRELSGGQQQRVAMARALVIDPEVIILDEPLSNLDRKLREEMRLELKRLQRSLGVTMLLVTHDQEEALSMSDKVVVMHKSRIQQVANPRDSYERPANSFVASFLGSANLLPGKVVETLADGQAVFALSNGKTISSSHSASLSRGQDASLVVRPEWLSVDRSADAANALLQGDIREVTYEGLSLRYEVALPGTDRMLSVHELSSTPAMNVGQRVSLNVRNSVVVAD
ncbi:ABC transporter ATP-binding protein [Pseudogemmobacter sonorensis]|uniref:ABC transporter ATP-binding protein n=1 Tax=Pseudogemmobacter sonorensis TaxID=2989681 RepID=UPI0036AD50AC